MHGHEKDGVHFPVTDRASADRFLEEIALQSIGAVVMGQVGPLDATKSSVLTGLIIGAGAPEYAEGLIRLLGLETMGIYDGGRLTGETARELGGPAGIARYFVERHPLRAVEPAGKESHNAS